MLVKENLGKNGKNIRMSRWKTNVNQIGNIVEATQLDGNRIVCFLGYENLNHETLTEGEEYTLQFDFQKIMGQEIRLSPHILNGKTISIKDNNLNKMQFKGRYKQSTIDFSTDDTKTKFMIRNFIFSKGEEFPDLWIPAKTDLPTNQQGYYPPDGDYNEIKAI